MTTEVASAAGQWVVVEAGQTLWSLAQEYYGAGQAWPRIYAANPELSPTPDLVITGQRVFIPSPPQQQPPPPASQRGRDQDGLIVMAIAAVLITAVSAAAAADVLYATSPQRQLIAARFPRPALEGALDVVMSMPPDRSGVGGSASLTVARLNLMRRAQFVLNAAKRLAKDVQDARSTGSGKILQALASGIARERRYFSMHMAAIWNRTQAAARVDSAALDYGDLLGWNTVIDGHTSAECRAANGKNFYASSMPTIGYPGMVHPHCRCYPGRPHTGAAMLPSARMAA